VLEFVAELQIEYMPRNRFFGICYTGLWQRLPTLEQARFHQEACLWILLIHRCYFLVVVKAFVVVVWQGWAGGGAKAKPQAPSADFATKSESQQHHLRHHKHHHKHHLHAPMHPSYTKDAALNFVDA
jgi:hypothetical protein